MRTASNNDSYLRKLKLFTGSSGYYPNSNESFYLEKKIDQLGFYKHVFNVDKNNRRLFVFALIEFGSELLLPHYFLHEVKATYPDHRIVVIGWRGRKFFYENIADEFWELKDDHMWLRETARAFNHISFNIKKLEKILKYHGDVFVSNSFAKMCLESFCNKCSCSFMSDRKINCPSCKSADVKFSFFADIKNSIKKYKNISYYNGEIDSWLKDKVPPNAIAIFARNRKTYGRNLPISFYVNLIGNLRGMGYEPIWVGEKGTVFPCPLADVYDFSSTEESNNLQYTLNLISKCKCTFQCWTASTRLAQITNTPFVLVESPDQIYGRKNHEGIRLALLSKNFENRKIILSDYFKSYNNLDKLIEISCHAVNDIVVEKDNSDIIGLVDDLNYVKRCYKESDLWEINSKMITLKDM